MHINKTEKTKLNTTYNAFRIIHGLHKMSGIRNVYKVPRRFF